MVQPDRAEQADSLLEQFLADRDVPCPVCGYNLRGLNSTNCPECGASLNLGVSSTDLKVGPWLVMLLGVSIPLGFCFIGTVFMVVMIMAAGGGAPPRNLLMSVGALAAGTVIYGLLAWVLVKKRRFFLRRRPLAQLLLAIGFVLISAVIGTAIGMPMWLG